MTKIRKIKIKSNPLNLLKETREERLERIHSGNLRTRVAKNKKAYDRNKFKRGE